MQKIKKQRALPLNKQKISEIRKIRGKNMERLFFYNQQRAQMVQKEHFQRIKKIQFKAQEEVFWTKIYLLLQKRNIYSKVHRLKY